MILHKHHIIPKHMGGSDDPSNILKCNAAMHAFLHHQLWLEYGKKEDYLAWLGLLGHISKDELLKEIYKENGRRCGKANKGRQGWNKGVPMTEEQKIKLRIPKSEETKQKLRKPKSNTDKMGRYKRTDETKNKLKKAVKKQFDEDGRKKHSEIMKSLRATCPFCGMESNKSNITRHVKAKRCLG